jgi:hypothetical protein
MPNEIIALRQSVAKEHAVARAFRSDVDFSTIAKALCSPDLKPPIRASLDLLKRGDQI